MTLVEAVRKIVLDGDFLVRVSHPLSRARVAGLMDSAPDGPPRSGKRQQEKEEDASGAAWGAHSVSAAKNKAINKAMQDSGKDPGFGDFGRYFSEKKRKLRDQFHEHPTDSFLRDFDPNSQDRKNVKTDHKAAESNHPKQQLFKGVAIFVDGFTIPSHQELRFLMMNHGGVFENYFSSQLVTHIICSTLPDSKIMNPRLMSRGLPIVKPEWIVDSIKENRLLPWANYQLERLAFAHPHQRTLAATFSAQNSSDKSLTNPSLGVAASHIPEDLERVGGGKNKVVPFSATDTWTEPEHGAGPNIRPGSASENEQSFQRLEQQANAATTHGQSRNGPEPMHDSHEAIVAPAESMRNAAPFVQKITKQNPPEGRGRSTMDDPNFVQSYFKNSRLHFIGTWRNRYQALVNAGQFGKSEKVLSMEASTGRSAIIHLDMDCFFVSVVIRGQAALVEKPVAVCHSDNANGTGEISSANYPARSFGGQLRKTSSLSWGESTALSGLVVGNRFGIAITIIPLPVLIVLRLWPGIRAGMFMRDAKTRCPELTIVPYDFAAYEQVADTVYSILHKHSAIVQAVSCDEAFLDVTGHPDPVGLARAIREEIFQATQCTASAGISENILLARLATKKAKPNGQMFIHHDEVKKFMAALPLDELPGVGWALQEKLRSHGLYTCADLQHVSKEALQRDYGAKTGVMLWSYAQGIDEREVQPAQERKSIGAEVNWGVRFATNNDAQQFLVTLSNEVAARMQKASSSGRTITLKVKRRKEGYGEPVKFMGCGVCDNISRSETLAYATNSADVLLRIGSQLFFSLHLDVQEVRGVGLQFSRLEPTNTGSRQQQQQHRALDSWLAPSNKDGNGKGLMNQSTERIVQPDSKPGQDVSPLHDARHISPSKETVEDDGREQRHRGKSEVGPSAKMDNRPTHSEIRGQTSSGSRRLARTSDLELPPLSQLDHSVLEFLPEDIVAEIDEAKKAHAEAKEREFQEKEDPMQRPVSEPQQQRPKRNTRKPPRNMSLELPPKSQIDPSVLEALPEEILAEINRAYLEEAREASRVEVLGLSGPPSNVETRSAIPGESAPVVDPNLARGPDDGLHIAEEDRSNPRSPVAYPTHDGQSYRCSNFEEFQLSLEKMIAGATSEKTRQRLSSGLLWQSCCRPVDESMEVTGLELFIQRCVELLMEHVRSIASTELEEVHLILLYTKRLATKCRFWKAVQELTTPAVKYIVGELYGGQLAI